MILNSTTDNLQVVLSGSVATRQLHFVSSYNILTSTGVTPSKSVGTTNNITPANLIPAPSSNQQHQLRFCSIYNVDTTASTVTVQFNDNGTSRVLYSAPLTSGESIQYNPNNGWQTYNYNGLQKVSGISMNPSSSRMLEYFNAINATTVLTLASGTDYAFYLGKADRAYSQVTIMCNVTTAIGATITYAEVAIYKGTPLIGSAATVYMCGWRECSGTTGQSNLGATGVKQIPIITTGITAGDDLWVVYGTQTSGTACVIRAGLVDDIGAGFIQTGTGRPSNTPILVLTKQTAQNNAWIAWQGFQW